MLSNIYHAGNEKLGWPRFDDSGFAVLHDADGPPELETSN